jgi:hypothetical protein
MVEEGYLKLVPLSFPASTFTVTEYTALQPAPEPVAVKV